MKEGDAESRFNAIAPRISRSTAAPAPVPNTIPPHTHSADQVGMAPAGNLEAINVQAGLQELDVEKLARDGSQPMFGDLDLDHFDILNVFDLEIENDLSVARNIEMSGGVGDAIINLVRRITMTGIGLIESVLKIDFTGAGVGDGIIDQVRSIVMNGLYSDYEARISNLASASFQNEPAGSVIDTLSRIDFNPAVVASDYEGGLTGPGTTAWDANERDLVAWLEEQAGILRVPFGWSVWVATRATEVTLTGPRVVVPSGSDGTVVSVVPWNGSTDHQPELTSRPMGMIVPSLSSGDYCVVIAKGIARGVTDGDETWSVGDQLWATDAGYLTNSRPAGPSPSIYVGRVIGQPSEGAPWNVLVDVQVIPEIGELSGVSREDPESLDVMVYNATDEVWVPRALFHVNEIVEDYTAVPEDNVILCDCTSQAITVTLPPVGPAAAMQLHIKKKDSSANAVTIDADGTEIIEDAETQTLLRQGECLTLQSTGGYWIVL